jgi:hypothetical protein
MTALSQAIRRVTGRGRARPATERPTRLVVLLGLAAPVEIGENDPLLVCLQSAPAPLTLDELELDSPTHWRASR